VSVVQEYLKPFMGETLFDDNILRSVAIHIKSGNRELPFGRRERDDIVDVIRKVQFNSKKPLAVLKACFPKEGSIRLLVIVEIGRDEGRSKIGG